MLIPVPRAVEVVVTGLFDVGQGVIGPRREAGVGLLGVVEDEVAGGVC
jgi:hypothetical protein